MIGALLLVHREQKDQFSVLPYVQWVIPYSFKFDLHTIRVLERLLGTSFENQNGCGIKKIIYLTFSQTFFSQNVLIISQKSIFKNSSV